METESANKFNTVYASIEKLLYHIAHGLENSEVFLLDFDEIVGELSLEVVKICQRYADKPVNELVALVKVAISNRVGELRYKHYVTSRKHARVDISIDLDETWDMIPSTGDNPEGLYASKQRVIETRARLSLPAQKVFDALIYGDERFSWLTWMACVRAGEQGKQYAKPVIRPYIVADALDMKERDVKQAMKEIQTVYMEVLGG